MSLDSGATDGSIVSETLDSGYQIVCTIRSASVDEVLDWLGEQLGYEFESGERITSIDHFQIVPLPDDLWCGVATCTIHQQVG